MVKVYTQDNCQPCKATIRKLDALQVEYEVYSAVENIDTLRDLGYSQAPVVMAGDKHWSGYRPEKIGELVGG